MVVVVVVVVVTRRTLLCNCQHSGANSADAAEITVQPHCGDGGDGGGGGGGRRWSATVVDVVEVLHQRRQQQHVGHSSELQQKAKEAEEAVGAAAHIDTHTLTHLPLHTSSPKGDDLWTRTDCDGGGGAGSDNDANIAAAAAAANVVGAGGEATRRTVCKSVHSCCTLVKGTEDSPIRSIAVCSRIPGKGGEKKNVRQLMFT